MVWSDLNFELGRLHQFLLPPVILIVHLGGIDIWQAITLDFIFDIKNDGEGGALVIISKQDYMQELDRLVNDTTTYLPLRKNPNKELRSKLKEFLNNGITNRIINKKEGRYILPEAPKVPVIYQVPKVHKNKTRPPGRLIISGIGSVHSRLGEYLDVFLQPLAGRGQAFIKDSKDIINILKMIHIDDSAILITIDVEPLYTNIKETDALAAVAWALKNQI